MKLAPIGDCVEKVRSCNPARDYADQAIKYIDLGSIENEQKVVVGAQSVIGKEAPSRARQKITAGDILVSTVRPYLNGVARVPDHLDGAIASTGFCILRASTGIIDPDYLFQWVKSPLFVGDMIRKSTGASYPAVSDRIVCESLVPLPPLPEQRRIAAILEQADALRRLRTRALSGLSFLGQAIFSEMFGSAAPKSPGFISCALGDVIHPSDNLNYGVVQPGHEMEDGIPLVRAGDLLRPNLNISGLKRISRSVEEKYKRSRLTGSEILIGCVGSIGAIAMATPELKGANIARAVARVPLDPNLCDRAFIAEQLKTSHIQRYFSRETRTVSQPTLNIKQIKEAPIFLPPLEVQRSFSARLHALAPLNDAIDASLTQLDNLFASLQHRAFRGEL